MPESKLLSDQIKVAGAEDAYVPKHALTVKNLEQTRVTVAKSTDDLMSYFDNQFDEYSAKAGATGEKAADQIRRVDELNYAGVSPRPTVQQQF